MHSKRIAFCFKNFSLSLSLSEVEHSIRFKQSFFHFSLAFSHLLLWGALSIPCKDHRPVSPCYHIWWWETEPLWDGLSWRLQSRCLRWFITRKEPRFLFSINSWRLLAFLPFVDGEDNNFFLHLNILIIYLTHNGV